MEKCLNVNCHMPGVYRITFLGDSLGFFCRNHAASFIVFLRPIKKETRTKRHIQNRIKNDMMWDVDPDVLFSRGD